MIEREDRQGERRYIYKDSGQAYEYLFFWKVPCSTTLPVSSHETCRTWFLSPSNCPPFRVVKAPVVRLGLSEGVSTVWSKIAYGAVTYSMEPGVLTHLSSKPSLHGREACVVSIAHWSRRLQSRSGSPDEHVG